MSFTVDIIDELASSEYEKTCCKKALLCGIFFAGDRLSKKESSVELKTEGSASCAVTILKKQFSAEPSVCEGVRAGRKYYRVLVDSRAVSLYLDRIDRDITDGEDGIRDIVGFRCPDCERAFLAGAFISSGTATDPLKRYSLELVAKSEGRAARLSRILCSRDTYPSCVDRRGRIGLYYRGNEAIADMLSYMGANRASFAVINAYMTRAIKNDENRATNCVLKNIERSVSSARRHIEAIEALKDSGRYETLEPELKYTAELRLAYDSATLSELAALHEPSISKSGLNKRLDRLLKLAAE